MCVPVAIVVSGVPITLTHPVNDVAVTPVYLNTSEPTRHTPALAKPDVAATLTVVEDTEVLVVSGFFVWSKLMLLSVHTIEQFSPAFTDLILETFTFPVPKSALALAKNSL